MIQQIDHEERRNSMHSTDVSAILGLNPKRDSEVVWLEKTGQLEPWDGNDATDAGKYLEPSILDYAESQLGPLERNVLRAAKWLDFPLASTWDARVIATGKPVEAKSTGIVGPVYGHWGEENTDDIPEVYLVQTTVQMVCGEEDLDHVIALIGGRGFVEYRVLRDEEVARAILEHCGRWWHRHVEQGIRPERVSAVPMEIVKRIRRKPKKTISLGPDSMLAIAEYDVAKEDKKQAKQKLEDAQSNLLMLLGDAEAGLLPDGRMVRYQEQHRRAFHVDECDFRVLRVLANPPADWACDAIEAPAREAIEVDYKVADRVKIPAWIKAKMLNDNPHCRWCGATLTRHTATHEHLVPLSKGGTNDETNLALACEGCNSERGDDATLPTTVSAKG